MAWQTQNCVQFWLKLMKNSERFQILIYIFKNWKHGNISKNLRTVPPRRSVPL